MQTAYISDIVYFQSGSFVHITTAVLLIFLLLFSFTFLGKACRLITFDSHKWNVNGPWIYIKIPDGFDWWQKTRAWVASQCHLRPVLLFLLTQKDIQTRWQGWMKEEKTAILKGQKAKWEPVDKEWLIMKVKMGRQREKTSSHRGLTCHVNKW